MSKWRSTFAVKINSYKQFKKQFSMCKETGIKKMRDELQKRLENKSEEYEYNYGIQKFDNAEDAFRMMSNVYGDESNNEYYKNVVIGNDAFTSTIFTRVLQFYYLAKIGAIPEEQFKAALMMNQSKTDELLSFNFLIYNDRNKCYYASLMEDWEDDKALLSRRQWDIYHEIWDAYLMDENLKTIVETLDRGVEEEYKDKPIDQGFFVLAMNKWFREDEYENMKPMVDDLGYEFLYLTNDDGETEKVYVHETVANAFVPNPDNLPYVRHKDGNKQNNNAANLEWTDEKPEYVD